VVVYSVQVMVCRSMVGDMSCIGGFMLCIGCGGFDRCVGCVSGGFNGGTVYMING
jgi:uncharacterized membrane protein required for colicin V production